MSHRHQVNGCLLPEEGDVERVLSTKRNFNLALFGELGSQDRQVKGRRRGVLEGHSYPASPMGRGRGPPGNPLTRPFPCFLSTESLCSEAEQGREKAERVSEKP